jgi:hypothetical protein
MKFPSFKHFPINRGEMLVADVIFISLVFRIRTIFIRAMVEIYSNLVRDKEENLFCIPWIGTELGYRGL